MELDVILRFSGGEVGQVLENGVRLVWVRHIQHHYWALHSSGVSLFPYLVIALGIGLPSWTHHFSTHQLCDCSKRVIDFLPSKNCQEFMHIYYALK